LPAITASKLPLRDRQPWPSARTTARPRARAWASMRGGDVDADPHRRATWASSRPVPTPISSTRAGPTASRRGARDRSRGCARRRRAIVVVARVVAVGRGVVARGHRAPIGHGSTTRI
jgi:hypothetical protein